MVRRNENGVVVMGVSAYAAAALLIIFGILALVSLIFGVNYAAREYGVWSAGMAGRAELARADFNRKIAVAEAEAKKNAAKSLAEADVIRARGIAKANKIVGDSLEKNEKYLEWKFIDELPQTKNQIIYLPSNSFMPILEANRASEMRSN